LYFAIALRGESEAETVARGGLGETGWTTFVEGMVTPLFPDGLSVFNATGQWLSDRFETPPKLDTRVIVGQHSDTVEADARIE
jgi:hypothetical protein